MTIDDRKQGDPSSTKYAFKQLPTFNPTYYRRWASDVQLAFGERRWMDYLVYPPDEKFKPDVHTLVRTKAFLSQAIPYEHGAGIEGCATAAEIFYSLQQHFGLASREDELRLELTLGAGSAREQDGDRRDAVGQASRSNWHGPRIQLRSVKANAECEHEKGPF